MDPQIALTDPEYGKIFIVIAIVVAPIAGIAFARSGSALKTLGKGAFSIETEPAPKPEGLTDSQNEASVQAIEVRQMLEAKSYRRTRRGEAALDIDAEMRRLMEPAGGTGDSDPSLREEVRQHVIASNERRVRRGREPLDVDAEVERRLQEF